MDSSATADANPASLLRILNIRDPGAGKRKAKFLVDSLTPVSDAEEAGIPFYDPPPPPPPRADGVPRHPADICRALREGSQVNETEIALLSAMVEFSPIPPPCGKCVTRKELESRGGKKGGAFRKSEANAWREEALPVAHTLWRETPDLTANRTAEILLAARRSEKRAESGLTAPISRVVGVRTLRAWLKPEKDKWLAENQALLAANPTDNGTRE